jgi:hypothetical protein
LTDDTSIAAPMPTLTRRINLSRKANFAVDDANQSEKTLHNWFIGQWSNWLTLPVLLSLKFDESNSSGV